MSSNFDQFWPGHQQILGWITMKIINIYIYIYIYKINKLPKKIGQLTDHISEWLWNRKQIFFVLSPRHKWRTPIHASAHLRLAQLTQRACTQNKNFLSWPWFEPRTSWLAIKHIITTWPPPFSILVWLESTSVHVLSPSCVDCYSIKYCFIFCFYAAM